MTVKVLPMLLRIHSIITNFRHLHTIRGIKYRPDRLLIKRLTISDEHQSLSQFYTGTLQYDKT